MPSIFISYSRADLNIVQQFEQALLANGHTVWRDQESLYGGQQWPKAIGEAIASRDFFLLVWSQHAASSHFVEFEWNTALALKKVILPCLLDDTPLPPSLRAINGIFCKDFETGLPRVLQALQQPLPDSASSHANAVINKLQTLSAATPEQVVQAAKMLFAEQRWNVQGNVYQAAGDINVTLAPPPEKPEKKLLARWQTWVAFISALVVLAGAISDLPKKIIESVRAVRESVAPECQFTGHVFDEKNKPVAGAEVIVHGRKGSGTTDANGEFSFAVKDQCGKAVQVSIKKDGVLQETGSQTLPGPVDLIFKGHP